MIAHTQVDYTKTRKRKGIIICPKCGRKGEGSLTFFNKRDGVWEAAQIRHVTEEETLDNLFTFVKVIDGCWIELTDEQKAFNERTKTERALKAKLKRLADYTDDELIAELKARGYEVHK